MQIFIPGISSSERQLLRPECFFLSKEQFSLSLFFTFYIDFSKGGYFQVKLNLPFIHEDLIFILFFPNSFGVKYYLIVLGVVNFTMSLFLPPYWSKNIFFYFKFVMTKAVSNREICFIKAVSLLCEHGYFKKKSKMVFLPPPNTIRVKKAN